MVLDHQEDQVTQVDLQITTLIIMEEEIVDVLRVEDHRHLTIVEILTVADTTRIILRATEDQAPVDMNQRIIPIAETRVVVLVVVVDMIQIALIVIEQVLLPQVADLHLALQVTHHTVVEERVHHHHPVADLRLRVERLAQVVIHHTAVEEQARHLHLVVGHRLHLVRAVVQVQRVVATVVTTAVVLALLIVQDVAVALRLKDQALRHHLEEAAQEEDR